MIILKNVSYLRTDIDNDFMQKYKELLNFNNDSVFIKSQNFLLISSHLSSKKIKSEQARILKKTLSDIIG